MPESLALYSVGSTPEVQPTAAVAEQTVQRQPAGASGALATDAIARSSEPSDLHNVAASGLTASDSHEDQAARAIAVVTNKVSGKVDFDRLADHVTSQTDFAKASESYAHIKSELAQRNPSEAQNFDSAVARAYTRGATDAVTAASTGLASAGKKVLVNNPILSKQWESTRSAWTGRGGFSSGLTTLLESHGIQSPAFTNQVPPNSLGKASGVPKEVANNVNGSAARDAIAERYRDAGHHVITEVSRQNGTRRVDVQVDVQAKDPRYNQRIDIESKVGRTTKSSTIAAQAAKDGEALAENGAVRGTGRALETAGKVMLPIAIAGDAIELGQAFHADGNKIGTETGRAASGIAGGWGGAIVGAEVGAAAGSFVPVVGTAIGGIIGGAIGGFGGDKLGRKVFDAIDSLF